MLVHRGQRRQPEAPADFLEAGGVPVLLDELVEVVEDFSLALGQGKHWALLSRGTIRKRKAKVNGRAVSVGPAQQVQPQGAVVGKAAELRKMPQPLHCSRRHVAAVDDDVSHAQRSQVGN